jgi:hypothetical protein
VVTQIIRKTVNGRYGVKHGNIVDVLGIDSRFSPHPGIVLEYCASRDLPTVCAFYLSLFIIVLTDQTQYCKAHGMDVNATARPSVPLVNAYSLVSAVKGD